jgi:Tol biopolymer transport system component
MAADGTNSGAHERDRLQRPDWSPDGKSIAFTSNRVGSKDIWVINTDEKGLLQLTAIGHRGESCLVA